MNSRFKLHLKTGEPVFVFSFKPLQLLLGKVYLCTPINDQDSANKSLILKKEATCECEAREESAGSFLLCYRDISFQKGDKNNVSGTQVIWVECVLVETVDIPLLINFSRICFYIVGNCII